MKMKKMMALVITFVMLTSVLVMPALADSKILFEDDFSSDNLAAKWINPALDGTNDTFDSECEDVTNMKDGVMELNNEDQYGSFFYIGMRDIKIKNFTLTVRVRANQFNGGWFGVSFRKDFNDRFNGCNNNMATITFRGNADGATFITAEAYRGYAGSSPVTLSNMAEAKVDAKVGEWVEWRLEVQDTSFKSYVNGKLIGQWEYKKNQNEGFISLNCCILDGAVDDVKLMEYEAMSSGGEDQPTDPQPTDPQPTDPNPTDPQPTDPQPTDPTPTEPSKQPLIERKYKDVTIDNTFHVITLDRMLTVEELLDSFYLADDVSIRVIDESGAEVADKSANVTDTMKMDVLRNDTVQKTYSLVINAEEPTAPTEPTVADPAGSNDPTFLIIGIVAAALVAVAVVVVIVGKRKAGKKA